MTDELLPVRVEPAKAKDDEAIRRMAGGAGLRLEPGAERGRSQARLLVARGEEDQVLGFALGWIVAEELELLDICVDASIRRRGVGRKLLAALLEIARQEGAHVAFLEVRRSNVLAQQLYASFEFQPQGERAHYYADGEDALIFLCCLDGD